MQVFVYFNLRRKLWSVRAEEGPNKGRVVAHATDVLLGNAEGKVSAAGRARVLREKRKNVHAGIRGELLSLEPHDFTGSKVTYNPYRYATFVHAATEAPFRGAERVSLSTSQGVRVSDALTLF